MIGISMSGNLSKRVSELELCLVLLEKIQTFLRYEQTPTGELMEKLASFKMFAPLPFVKECSRRLNQGESFPSAWEQGLNSTQNQTHLTPKDYAVLSGVAPVIGTSDAQGQISALDVIREMLNENSKEARQKKNTYGRLYRSLGVLSGIGLGIFLA